MLVHEPEVNRCWLVWARFVRAMLNRLESTRRRRLRCRRLFRDQLFLVCRHLPMLGGFREVDYFSKLLWEFVRFSRWLDPIDFSIMVS